MLLKLVLLLIAYSIGLVAMVAGEADDSPGLQGLGLLLIIFVSYRRFWRNKRR